MYVIGISSGIKHGHHDGAAVLLRDGELIAAAEEERFTLPKYARGELPRGAIGFCLKQAGITMRDVDWICSPLKTYTNYTQRLTEYFRYQFGHSPKIELYDHHLCHAASSFYGSGFSEATVACFDFSGDSSSGLVAHARGNDFRVLTRFGRNNSLGLYYGMLTQYLGYQMTNDEYKVMGLSSYGSPDYLDKFAKLLRPAGINYELDPGLDKRRRGADSCSRDCSEIAAEPSVKRLYVPPVPHDAGVALGAAMMKCTEAGHTIAPLTHAYWGPEYSNDTIKETLDKIGARFELLDDPVSRCVTDLTEQKTVGWFQGRMEYGPRALGNRSILADPRHAGMKDRINLTIKYREEFRPFCPSVLYDRQAEYFEDTFDAPFMVVTFPVSEKVAETMPAVVHVDNTARIQSVHADSNPLYSRLIGEFAKATSLPVLINTSLNINEQPTVNAPLEALHTYFCSGLDVLYLGPYRLSKPR